MRLLPSDLLPAGTWLRICRGTVVVARDLYATAGGALLSAEGLRPEEAPPWLLEALAAAERPSPPDLRWTGPLPEDWEPGGGLRLRLPVPEERWPFGPAEDHGPGCALREGGTFCDCCGSVASCECHPRGG